VHKDTLIIRFSAHDTPTQLYAVSFRDLAVKTTLRDLAAPENLSVKLLDSVKLGATPLEQELLSFLPTIRKETLTLDNGAQGHFVYAEGGSPRPMLLVIHGGPFGCGPQDMFLQLRTFFLLQGYSLLILNYRGSTSYGEDFLNSLLGHIGDRDVHDCGRLAKEAIARYPTIVDPARVGVYGASHGGFLTGWLIGHPDYCKLFKASVLWNPVINMSYMYASTDIPDWIVACCLGKDWSHKVTAADNQVFFEKSPVSVVQNVTTPALVLIGNQDRRVTPHAGVQYHHQLKEQGVDTKLFMYPEDGHAIASSEPSIDATINILMWLDERL